MVGREIGYDDILGMASEFEHRSRVLEVAAEVYEQANSEAVQAVRNEIVEQEVMDHPVMRPLAGLAEKQKQVNQEREISLKQAIRTLPTIPQTILGLDFDSQVKSVSALSKRVEVSRNVEAAASFYSQLEEGEPIVKIHMNTQAKDVFRKRSRHGHIQIPRYSLGVYQHLREPAFKQATYGMTIKSTETHRGQLWYEQFGYSDIGAHNFISRYRARKDYVPASFKSTLAMGLEKAILEIDGPHNVAADLDFESLDVRVIRPKRSLRHAIWATDLQIALYDKGHTRIVHKDHIIDLPTVGDTRVVLLGEQAVAEHTRSSIESDNLLPLSVSPERHNILAIVARDLIKKTVDLQIK